MLLYVLEHESASIYCITCSLLPLQNDIKMLKDKLNPTCDDQTTPITGTDHTPSHEILMKELAAHKEMVAELRGQLEEKETEFQVIQLFACMYPALLSVLCTYFGAYLFYGFLNH